MSKKLKESHRKEGEIPCPSCGSEDCKVFLEVKPTRFRLTAETFSLVKCTECGLIYLKSPPKKNELEKYYSESYYKSSWLETLHSRFVIKLKSREIAKIKSGGRILDLGCGRGDFLLEMKKLGWNTFGVDTSEVACALAKARVKENVYNHELKNCNFPDNFFDVITTWHVLEHISNPNQILQEINRILKNDGLIILEVPNIDNLIFRLTRECYFALDVPLHICNFSFPTLKTLLEKNGFTILRTDFPILSFPLSVFKSFSNILVHRYETSPLYQRYVILALISLGLFFLTVITRILTLFVSVGEVLRVYCTKKCVKIALPQPKERKVYARAF